MDADLLRAWDWQPSVVAGLLALAALDAGLVIGERRGGRGDAPGQAAMFALGLIALGLALISPLDALADHTMLTAHMAQHLILLLLTPTLLLLGAPERLLQVLARIARWPVLRWLGNPVGIFVLATLVLWVWHLPPLYEAALASESLHAMEHLTYLATATLYWWPVLRSETYPWAFVDPLQLLYIFGGAVTASLPGILITFSPEVIYPTYLQPTIFGEFRAALGLTALDDQVIGGLVMWTIGGFWNFAAAMIVFGRWLIRDERHAAEIDQLVAGHRPSRVTDAETENQSGSITTHPIRS